MAETTFIDTRFSELALDPETGYYFDPLGRGLVDRFENVLLDADTLEVIGPWEGEEATETTPGRTNRILMRAAEGFSYREIADSLEIPMGTVMSHLHRARARLRESLTEHVEATGGATAELGDC